MATLIEATDVIDVQFVPVLIFGPPGSRKTSLAQTADAPFTLDLDEGIHRSPNRRAAARFASWDEVGDLIRDARPGARSTTTDPRILEKFKAARTVVVDTLGRALDKMIPGVQQLSPKNVGPGGMGLSPQGYGVLGNQFAHFIKSLRDLGKDLVMVCHEDQGTDASGDPVVSPDMLGKMSWKEVHKWTDQIGRMRYDGRSLVLDFNPSSVAVCCKNAGQLPPTTVPDFAEAPRLLADLIALAKERIGKTAAASAALAQAEAEVSARLAACDTPDALTAALSEWAAWANGKKARAWEMVKAHAAGRGWEFDKASRRFVVGTVPTAPAPAPESERELL